MQKLNCKTHIRAEAMFPPRWSTLSWSEGGRRDSETSRILGSGVGWRQKLPPKFTVPPFPGLESCKPLLGGLWGTACCRAGSCRDAAFLSHHLYWGGLLCDATAFQSLWFCKWPGKLAKPDVGAVCFLSVVNCLSAVRRGLFVSP